RIGATLTGLGVDDPDANFYENFACGSPRNYSFYCSEQVMKMIDQQSMELDPAKRLALVIAVQKQLEQDAARPTLDQRLDYFTVWPHVKNMVPHHNTLNFGRMPTGLPQLPPPLDAVYSMVCASTKEPSAFTICARSSRRPPVSISTRSRSLTMM